MIAWLLVLQLAVAGEPDPVDGSKDAVVDATLHGDVKLFTIATFPYAWITAPEIPPELEPFLPDDFDADELLDQAGLGTDATVSGAADFRLKAELELGESVRVSVHHALSLQEVAAGGLGLGQTGVGRRAPELIDLTWEADTGNTSRIQGRTDRAVVTLSRPGVDVALGRQPVTFGSGMIFTPMDVVNPFTPATIDTEYKPGIDALRVDGYAGVAGQVTGVAAWARSRPATDPNAGPAELSDALLAVAGQGTVGVTDLQGLVALARAEPVIGLGVLTGIGPVGVHGEGTLTWPVEDARESEPFVRAVVGADGRPTSTTFLAGEVAYQGTGATDPAEYLEVAEGPRFARGEIWQMGRWYAALSVAQEVTPLLSTSLAVISNLADPSALVAPGLSWSVDDNSVVTVGGYVGVGARPKEVPLGLDPAAFAVLEPDPDALASSVQSEFGLSPAMLFVAAKAYF